VQEGGKWVLDRAPSGHLPWYHPETLQQMLENQFEQLSAEEQRILEPVALPANASPFGPAAAMLKTTLPTLRSKTCDMSSIGG